MGIVEHRVAGSQPGTTPKQPPDFQDQTKLKNKNMKTKTLLTTLIIGAICQFAPSIGQAQDVDSMAPVVVKTVPEAGTKDVSPGIVEIKVTFSKEMTDQSWSWSSAWKDSTPESIGKPHYETDHKTCVMKVKLEPGKTYGWWINSQNFHGFKDAQGHSAVPYLLVFQTKSS
jgi:RNA polymerase sigma-70 factor (ECF subfamily)